MNSQIKIKVALLINLASLFSSKEGSKEESVKL